MGALAVIVAAMEREASAFRDGCLPALDPGWRESVQVHVTNVGKERAIAKTAALVAGPSKPRMILAVGFCGALSEGLHTGDLVVSRNLYATGCDTRLESGDILGVVHEVLEDAGSLRSQLGDVLTVPQTVLRAGDKARLFQETGALAANMEDYWICNVAQESGVPFLSVRSVLDTARQGLPPFVAELGEKGRMAQTAIVIAGCVGGPWHIPGILKLSKQVRYAQESLAAFGLLFARKIQTAGTHALL